MAILKVSRSTIYNWFNNWEEEGLIGLYDYKGRGRKKLFNKEQQQQLKEWTKETPKQLNLVQDRAEKEWGIKASKDTIKRVLKSVNFTWHRIRKVLGGKPNEEEYADKTELLEELKEKERKGDIDLRYLDEVGFSLIPCVPYCWQEIGEQVTIKSERSKRLNVLGFFNRKNELESYIFEDSITSNVVVACIDDFCKKIQKETVLVMDRASIHDCAMVREREKEWKQKGLTLFWLPTYSSELNIIEILWRFIKYSWLKFDAYSSWESLVEAVENILRNVGKKYVINFA
jgi:transposase